MAISKNVLTHGLSGKIGDIIVFRQAGGKTLVSSAPKQQTKPPTENQKEQQRRFQQAVVYAKAAVASPDGDLYREKAVGKKGKTAMNIAVADYFNAPDIEHIDLTHYTGHEGDGIGIIVTDDFMVKYVHVSIATPEGEEIESGEATQQTGQLWGYTATQNNEHPDGCRIQVTASDLPGNITTDEIVK